MIAATIVLGLIPIFLADKDVTVNSCMLKILSISFKYLFFISVDALRSKDIVMSIEVEANESFISQRRKRDPGD